ncbi:MAG: GPR endopeptidase [Defluviitaleaceae bacterium]|nr:GPR endopeptidase [Defluviitaleaceae bacterium]
MNSTKHEFVDSYEPPNGVTLDTTETELCQCIWVQIQNESGVEAMGKPVGNYATIETDILLHGKMGELDEIAKTVSEYLAKMINISDEDSVLIVGIGNRNIISDSLGVRVADKVMATRHVAHQVEASNGKPIRTVSVISPGVMGVTGISTAEIIKSICNVINPSLVILVDALAAGKTSRLCSTIQITDTGMTPAAGILGKGNAQTIDFDYLGIPVVGIGMPTVINAATIMIDFISLLSQAHSDSEELDVAMVESIHQYADELFPSSSFVATKEIDAAIHYSSYVLSTAINMALFQEDWVQMSHNTY